MSSILNGLRRKKSDAVFDLLGDVDELSAFLGSAKLASSDEEKNIFEEIQKNLHLIMGIISNMMQCPEGVIFNEEKYLQLEKLIDKYCEGKDLKNFVLPGGSEYFSRLHLARTVCRRAERNYVKFLENINYKKPDKNSEVNFADEGLQKNILVYLNRLSDLLFAMSIK